MARRSSLRSRLERVLALTERWLEERLGGPPPTELFAAHAAFRWESDGGRGRLAPVLAPAAFEFWRARRAKAATTKTPSLEGPG